MHDLPKAVKGKPPEIVSAGSTINPDEHHGVIVTLHGVHCVQTGANKWDIKIPSRIMTNQESDLLQKLFPNTEHLISKAMDTESLLSCLQK